MKLKNWCINLILIVQAILICILAFECNNTMIFIISKIIIVILILLNNRIIKKYTNLFD